MLFGVCYWPKSKRVKAGVVTVPGFSQPKCDVDYFMSRIARRLVDEELFVLQLDPRGHGDSPGNLEDVTLDSLRADIKSGIEFIRNNVSEEIDIYGISRGLNATLLTEEMGLKGIAGVSPYCLEKTIIEGIWGSFEKGVYEISEIASTNEREIKAFFDSVGARETNVYGQKISTTILKQLMIYDAGRTLNKYGNNGFWLFYNEEEDDNMKRWMPHSNTCYFKLEQYANNPLPRVAIWQHNAIEHIVNWLLEKVNEKK
jgi:esterase/lipase